MWGLFAAESLIAVVFLYLPGYLLASLTRLSRFMCLAVAPLISSLAYFLLAYLFSLVGVASSWVSLFVPTAIAAVLFYVCQKYYFHSRNLASQREYSEVSLKIVLLYIAVALVVAGYFFVRTLDGAASIYQENDNIFHLTVVRDFLDSGVYALASLLQYPASWHVLVAMVASALSAQELTVAVNAVNFVLLILVVPISVLAFLAKLFSDKKELLPWGSIAALGFAAFPWGFLLFGPLYPNLFGYCMLPAAMAMFISIFQVSSKKKKLVYSALFALLCASLVFAHPNAIFVGVVLLTPYCVSQILLKFKASKVQKYLASILFVVFVLAVWTLLYFAPAFQSTVLFSEWKAYLPAYQAIVNGLMGSFTKASAPQFIMAICIVAGAIYCVLRKRYRWLVWSYLVLFAMRIVNVSTDGVLKHYLTGFWYTDEFRVAAALAIAGIPLAVIGMYVFCRILKGILAQFTLSNFEARGIAVVFAAILFVANFMPSFNIPRFGDAVTGFGMVDDILTGGNSLATNQAGFDKDEIAFSEEVKSIVGDEKVLNFPYDGSAYAYAVCDLNVTNRKWYGYSDLHDDPEAVLIRSEVNTVASNAAVKSALEDSDISYLILLDQGNETGAGLYDSACDYDLWTGILSVTDSTPGFDLVLSEGDMRLYKIVE